MSEAWKVSRANELHHIAMSHVAVQIRNLCMPRSYRFAEGASDGIFLAERRHALPSVPGSERLAAAEQGRRQPRPKVQQLGF